MLELMLAHAERAERHRVEEEAIREERAKLIVAAYSEGCSVVFIARTLGVARQTVYTALEAHDNHI